jgi:hypothetical protein
MSKQFETNSQWAWPMVCTPERVTMSSVLMPLAAKKFTSWGRRRMAWARRLWSCWWGTCAHHGGWQASRSSSCRCWGIWMRQRACSSLSQCPRLRWWWWRTGAQARWRMGSWHIWGVFGSCLRPSLVSQLGQDISSLAPTICKRLLFGLPILGSLACLDRVWLLAQLGFPHLFLVK